MEIERCPRKGFYLLQVPLIEDQVLHQNQVYRRQQILAKFIVNHEKIEVVERISARVLFRALLNGQLIAGGTISSADEIQVMV